MSYDDILNLILVVIFIFLKLTNDYCVDKYGTADNPKCPEDDKNKENLVKAKDFVKISYSKMIDISKQTLNSNSPIRETGDLFDTYLTNHNDCLNLIENKMLR